MYGWAETDFSLYSGAHIGMMGAVIQRTDVDGILRINCGAQASEQEDFAAFLLFNPHEKEKTVTYLLEIGRAHV